MYKIQLTNNSEIFQKAQGDGGEMGNSFLQSFEYGELQKRLGHEPLYLILEKDGKERALLFVLFKAKRGTYLFCPYGVIDEEMMESLIPFLKNLAKEHHVDFLRFSPLLEDSLESKNLFRKYSFRNAPVHMMHPELLWLLNLDKDEKTLMQDMRKNTRYALKQAGKLDIKIKSGVTDDLLKEFYEIHAETSRRQKFVPYPYEYLKAQLDIFGAKDQIKIYVAEYEGKNISAAVIMFYGKEAVYHHGASLSEYNKIPSSYLIQWKAIKEAQKRGLPNYNFWGVVENAPKHPWAGLSFFKQGFGGEGKNILHCQDLPLTWKYWLNFLVETVRRIKRGY